MPEIDEIRVWIGELDEVETRFQSRDALIRFVRELRVKSAGRLCAFAECGLRPRWKRLLGMSEYECFSLFALEWSDGAAALIFNDDDWSEYRAVDSDSKVEAPESVRLRIAHGDSRPWPADQTLDAARAFLAVGEYLEGLRRPEWLQYRYIK